MNTLTASSPAVSAPDLAPITLATTDGRLLYTSASTTHVMPAPYRTAGELGAACLRLAQGRGIAIRQLWLHGPYAESVDFTADLERQGGWDIQADRPRRLQYWTHTFPRGTYLPGGLDLVRTPLEKPRLWDHAGDAGELLDALALYRKHVGLAFHHTPAATAADLLRSIHRDRRAVPLEVVGEWPEPAHDTRLEMPIGWARLLSASERGMRYLHAYDRNACYLAACSSLDVGSGLPEHVAGPVPAADLKLPGYFLVSMMGTAAPGAIPSFVRDERGGPRCWMTTPTLTLLRERGDGGALEVHEAWVWRRPNVHRPLTSWYERIKGARAALMDARDAGTHGADVALAAVKKTYAAFGGGYLAGGNEMWDRSQDALYRPDIRHFIIATARANLIRLADKCVAAGAAPVALTDVDTLYLVSDEPDAEKAAPSVLRIGHELGKVKAKFTVALDDVPDARAALTDARITDDAERAAALAVALTSYRRRGSAVGA